MNDTTGITNTAKKRPRLHLPWWGWVAVGVAVVVIAAGAFVGVEYARSTKLGDLSPAENEIVASDTVTISCALAGYEPGEGKVSLALDGKAVSSDDLSLQSGLVSTRATVEDGPHTVTLDYTSSNLFSRHISHTWTFTVDTTAPKLTIDSPSAPATLGKKTTHFVIRADEEATIHLTVDGEPVDLTTTSGTVTTAPTTAAAAKTTTAAATIATVAQGDVTMAEGEHTLVLTATDAAGNRTSKEWKAWVDYQAPVVTLDSGPKDGATWKKSSATLVFSVTDNFPQGLTATATIDGKGVAVTSKPVTGKPATGTAAKTAATGTTTTGETVAGETAPPSGRTFTVKTGALAEGDHRVVFIAQDRGGHATTWKGTFLVDSTDSFGTRTMTSGATGADVTQLQKLLTRKGFYTGKATGVYDKATTDAVAAFNAARGLSGGAVVDKNTLKHLVGSIRIDLSARQLSLYDEDKLVKTYSVAVGMPAYPTPTGSYAIISKERNPTWNPPNSPWAAGAKPIGPGPNCPLGTRWMGLNAPSIGIHGTNNSASIGTAASHGCIRMHTAEAEDLFERIYIGTPVTIVS
ncbi:MAG: L,D-transpeptidase family protein [Thermoleophilia bacterium]|jgi:lipoprotein-anchoring transpeptidase ErfK/SrfK